jgi:hypothetical protein
MKTVRQFMGVTITLAILSGCAATPVQQEVQLPSQSIDQAAPSEGRSFVVMYNDSNQLMYGIDGSGKINVSLDGKGVGRLSIGRYVVVETSIGSHTVDLAHRDMMIFDSTHELEVPNQLTFVRIYSKVTSNGLEITERPEDFESEFSAAY